MMSPDRAARRAYVHFVHESLTSDTAVQAGRIALLDANHRLAEAIDRLVDRPQADHGPAGPEAFREQAGPLVAELQRRLQSALSAGPAAPPTWSRQWCMPQSRRTRKVPA